MKLSVITINYNNLVGLQKTYGSVVSQQWKDFEWIVIDGGSTDGSKEFIEEHQNRFLYWCSESDNGIYNAMNKGIARASGQFLNFLNSGDYYCDSNTLKEVFRKDPNADVLYGNTFIHPGDHWELLRRPEHMTLAYLMERSICHQASFIRTSLLKDSHYREDLLLVSDWERFITWFLDGYQFEHLHMPIVYYDVNGISANHMLEQEKERISVLEELFHGRWDIIIKEMKRQRESLEQYDIYEYKAARRLVERGHLRKYLLRGYLNLMDSLDKLIKSYY